MPSPTYTPFQTEREWEAFCARYGNRCVCCRQKKPLTVDHIDPCGPRLDIDNVQPLCVSCNSIKGKKYIDYRYDSEGVFYVRICPKCRQSPVKMTDYRLPRALVKCRTVRCGWEGDVSACHIFRIPAYDEVTTG